MKPWLMGGHLDCPLELSESGVNLLSLKIGSAKVGMGLHAPGIYFCGSYERLHSTVEVAGFAARHSDDDVRLVIVGIDSERSFSSNNGFRITTPMKLEQANVVPAGGELGL